MKGVDVLIIGAGAAGLMCAIEAGKRGRSVLVLDHANKPGKKILMSGGGRCNFTNLNVTSDNFISHNPQFCKSALSRYTPRDFVSLVKQHNIAFHEKTLGQLFCDNSAKDIVNLLLTECATAHVTLQLSTDITNIISIDGGQFKVVTSQGDYHCQSLVIATGGLSIPTMGASPFGYKIAEQFGLKVWPTRAGLVPFTLHNHDKETFVPLSGVSVDCIASTDTMAFREAMLFTHRGLSGPAILQISSYWQQGETLAINLLPDLDLLSALQQAKMTNPNLTLKNYFAQLLPKRLVTILLEQVVDKTLHQCSDKMLQELVTNMQQWPFKPNGTEGYRTAEVTLGGVDCNAISSKTFMANKVTGLYFIGEVLDVTGWLGGYNFQWAWASGFAAGQYT
jgi:predicted Rossmann fold flavoprotein